jgi:PAS domain S-box-containing protein
MSQIDPQLFQGFSDAMPFGACLVDLQGKIVYWNAAAEDVTGYMRTEVLGRAYRGDLLIQCGSANDCAETQCPVLDVLRDGTSLAADLFLRHKGGHRIAVRVFAFPLRNAMGEMLGVGEIFEPSQQRQESSSWAGHSDREFEMATGLPAVGESQEQLQTMLRSHTASHSALLLIEMSEQQVIMQHGGTPMLHQAIRVLAKTVSGLLPTRHYVGCWTDWRLIAMIPECKPEILEKLKVTLAGVGSSCAVKWWGDRVTVGMRTAARYLDPLQSADALIESLESDLKSGTDRKAE